MSFFTKESVAFWKGLAKNNSKAWFDENRKDYEKHLKKFLKDAVRAFD